MGDEEENVRDVYESFAKSPATIRSRRTCTVPGIIQEVVVLLHPRTHSPPNFKTFQTNFNKLLSAVKVFLLKEATVLTRLKKT